MGGRVCVGAVIDYKARGLGDVFSVRRGVLVGLTVIFGLAVGSGFLLAALFRAFQQLHLDGLSPDPRGWLPGLEIGLVLLCLVGFALVAASFDQSLRGTGVLTRLGLAVGCVILISACRTIMTMGPPRLDAFVVSIHPMSPVVLLMATAVPLAAIPLNQLFGRLLWVSVGLGVLVLLNLISTLGIDVSPPRGAV